MSDPLETLTNSMINRSYYSLSPEKLSSLHELSKHFLGTNQFTIQEDLRLNLLEQHFYLAILTCHDAEAKLVLQRLTDKFTDSPSRIAILRSQYIEATEGVEAAEKYLNSRPPTDFTSYKRKISLLKHQNATKKYIEKLLKYVEQISPNDVEALSELSEAYSSIGNYQQAIHCLEEVLINAPQAFNIFSRLGELYLIESSNAPNTNTQLPLLTISSKHFLRSIELSPDYIRGWCGILTTSSKILSLPKLPQEDSNKHKKLLKISKSQINRLIANPSQSSIPEEEISAAKLINEKYN